MKWGVRRYQNPDGSLTNAGKKRLDNKVTRTHSLVDKIEKHQGRANAALQASKGHKILATKAKNRADKIGEQNTIVNLNDYCLNMKNMNVYHKNI